MKKRFLLLTTLMLGGAGAVVLVACGSSSSDGAASDADSGLQADGGDASITDGATGIDGEVTTTADGSLFGAYDGRIVFTRAPGTTDVFGAGFFDLLSACTVSTNGPCETTSCRIVSIGDAAPPIYPAAGAMTLSGGVFGGGIVVEPTAQGIYEYRLPVDAGPPFSGGDTLGVSASGGAVPAFTQSITAPGCVALMSPVIDPDAGHTVGGTAEFSTSQDLDVAWTGGQAGAVVFAEVSGITADGNTEISTSCAFDATSGHGTVPQASLAPLVGLSSGAFGYGQVNLAVFATGSKQVLLSASCEAEVGAAL